MYLKSTVAVTYNDTKSTSKTVLMTGTIKEIYKNLAGTETKIIYEYRDVDGVLYSNEAYILTDEERDTMYPVIEASLPDITVVGEAAYDIAKYYEGFKHKMAERFPELEVADITVEA